MPLPPLEPMPGPGHYNVVDYEGPPKHYMSSSAFVSTTSRWTGGVLGEEDSPGPGMLHNTRTAVTNNYPDSLGSRLGADHVVPIIYKYYIILMYITLVHCSLF